MIEHPIIFTRPMVRAILALNKTQTRRVITPPKQYQDIDFQKAAWWEPFVNAFGFGGYWTPMKWIAHRPVVIGQRSGAICMVAGGIKCPYGVPGDILWVREKFSYLNRNIYSTEVVGACFRHIGGGRVFNNKHKGSDAPEARPRFTPSIQMPRWASRIDLLVKNVRAERVQEITIEDAKAEGVKPLGQPGDSRRWRGAFRNLWDSIYAKRGYSWDSNPWVWAVEFELIKPAKP